MAPRRLEAPSARSCGVSGRTPWTAATRRTQQDKISSISAGWISGPGPGRRGIRMTPVANTALLSITLVYYKPVRTELPQTHSGPITLNFLLKLLGSIHICMGANRPESIMLTEAQAPLPNQGLDGQYINGSWPARRIGSLGSNILRMATLCAAAVVAACTPTVMRGTSTPSGQQRATSISRAEQEAVRLDQLPAIPAPHTADHSGRKVVGKASFYARYFDGRKMADGHRFNPATNVAASKTLPIGTTARVINLDNGKSATVTVEDRGPYVRGRMLDVSPKVAATLRMKKSGIAHVVVKPITVPQPDGRVKLGAGAADSAPSQAARLTTSRVSAG